ncbi:sensor histidine kinase [Paenibacillus alkaliterrae]|uniref:sensor histidine kinase n=1 Tax=Paenibacillus alkaliterrae TaxID=320909 RepID=UPI001F3EAAF1|nr:sensor histidine kinase [Paenibacillus alkaliterrae]MCF2939359.1 sensor histidine kinase [Paenibacillus alkaliterrae]
MTIRTKLLVFIPLLVLLVNSVTFFLFQSGTRVQESYNLMMNRILLYKQSAQAVDNNLQLLYTYLINPDETRRQRLTASRTALREHIARLQDNEDPVLPFRTIESYIHMMDTFLEQEREVFDAMEKQAPRAALADYAEAEKTAVFIREESQLLVDKELSFYQPIYKQIQDENERMNRLGAAVLFINTLMSILLALWISRSITWPVSQLVARAKQISKGDLLAETPPPRSGDELGVLSGAFDQMSSDLLVLIEKEKESLEKDRLVKELELQALQSQINPHFLFNTLNVLSKLALLEGAEKTSDLIVSMSNLLRYNLRNLDQPVTLRDELEHVKEYFTIQQARFRDRIRLELAVEQSALQQAIPSLTLQPIVENAFLHGIERMEKDAYIRLEIVQDDDGIKISVSDNGCGMSEEARQALLRMESGAEKKLSTGLGTKNVFKRLQLFYGEADLVAIDSAPGKGTTVTIRIPPRKEDE